MSNAAPTSDDVAAALAKVVPTASDQSVRLFSLACLRRVRGELGDVFRDALDVAQRHVDGRATDAELGEAVRSVKRASGRRHAREWAVYHAVRYKPGSPQAEAKNVAAWAAEIAWDAIALPDPSAARFSTGMTCRIFGFGIATDSDPFTELASSDRPPSVDALPGVVAAYERAMSELRELERADELENQRQVAENEAALQREHADAVAARQAAYDAEVVAQLAMIDALFRSTNDPSGDVVETPTEPACSRNP